MANEIIKFGKGRPPKETFVREWAWVIQNVIIHPTEGKWSLQQLKAIIALGIGKTKKKAALCTAGKDGKCVTAETIQNWMSIPSFQSSVEAVTMALAGDFANEVVKQMYEDSLVPLDEVDVKGRLAHVKNRELVMKMLGRLKDGTGGTVKNQTAIQAESVNLSLQGQSTDNLIAIGQRKKTVATVKAEQVEYENTLEQEEIEDGVIDES
jgi:hypothetical protein